MKKYIDQKLNKDLAILIPGAGNSYEAIYLMEQGFTNITVIDIAPTVIQLLKEKYPIPHANIYQNDSLKCNKYLVKSWRKRQKEGNLNRELYLI